MNRRQFIVVGIGAGLAGCTGLSNGGSDVQDSDGDGVIDSEDYAPNDPDVQEKADVSGGSGGEPVAETDTPADSQSTGTPTPADTSTPDPEPDGWSVRIEYDGRWQGTVSVTTPEGDSHQAFDDQKGKTVDVEAQMGVDTGDVLSITATGQKEVGDDRTLRIEIRRDGDTVATGSTDEPHGETVVTHHEKSDTGSGETPTDTPAPSSTDTPAPDSSIWSVHIEHDGSWTVTISVTTSGGDSHQAFEGDGDETVAVDAQMGVDPDDVVSITATGQKEGANNRTLRIEIRKDGDTVAGGATDEPAGQVVVTHHE